MKYYCIAILLLTFISIITVTESCSCVPSISATHEANQSNAVFAGKVTSIVFDSLKRQNIVSFNVIHTFKGLLKSRRIVRTAKDSVGECGFPFEIDQNYLVYAYGTTNTLETNNCLRTTLLNDGALDIMQLWRC